MSTNQYRKTHQVTIASGASVSEAMQCMDSGMLGFIMSPAWDTAALNLEVSMDGTNFATVIYDGSGLVVSSWSSPVAGAAYAVDVVSMLPWRYIRFRSGTSGVPVNQTANRLITAIMRALA